MEARFGELFVFPSLILPEKIMSKSQDAKKSTKKEPAKTMKEKRADKKVKKEEKKRQQ